MLALGLGDWENLEVPIRGGTRRLGTSKAIKILDTLRKLR